MNTQWHKSHITGLFQAAVVLVLLLMVRVSDAQTFFGSGGSTNTATNALNVALGYSALSANTSGDNNSAFGWGALAYNTTGYDNTAMGRSALAGNTTGIWNTAIGSLALASNTANYNTAIGYAALASNTTGGGNTATGTSALDVNTTGSYNTAYGTEALGDNTSGFYNTASGYYALLHNTTGNANTANGYQALFADTSGSYNIAEGYGALYSNTTGYTNTASGVTALYENTSGSNNTAFGTNALFDNTIGSSNIAIGYAAGQNLTTGSNNIDIGNLGVAAESGVIRIGTKGTQTATFIAGINGATASGGVTVFINSNGQLGTLTSSRRFKKDIHTMGQASDRLMQLRPVTFRYKQAAADGTYPLQYGLIAEEVAKVYPDLVQYDKEGKPFTIYYHLLTPMLLNELQKEHRQNQAQKTEIDALRATLQKQSAELAALKQSQHQLNALTQRIALLEASQNRAQPRQAVAMRH